MDLRLWERLWKLGVPKPEGLEWGGTENWWLNEIVIPERSAASLIGHEAVWWLAEQHSGVNLRRSTFHVQVHVPLSRSNGFKDDLLINVNDEKHENPVDATEALYVLCCKVLGLEASLVSRD